MTELEQLKDGWQVIDTVVVSGGGPTLRMRLRYDGYGNAVVRWHLLHDGKDTAYIQYDAAIYNYNLIVKRAKK